MGTRVTSIEEDVNKYTIGDMATSLSDFYVIYPTHKISEAYKKILSQAILKFIAWDTKLKESSKRSLFFPQECHLEINIYDDLKIPFFNRHGQPKRNPPPLCASESKYRLWKCISPFPLQPMLPQNFSSPLCCNKQTLNLMVKNNCVIITSHNFVDWLSSTRWFSYSMWHQLGLHLSRSLIGLECPRQVSHTSNTLAMTARRLGLVGTLEHLSPSTLRS